MGRSLKNFLPTVGYVIGLPQASNSSPSPSTLVDGMMRFNTSTNRVQFVHNSTWRDMTPVGTVGVQIQEEIGDGTQTQWTMDTTVSSAADVVVFVGGVYQQPVVNYTVSGTDISFTSPPPAQDGQGGANRIVIIYNLNSTNAD